VPPIPEIYGKAYRKFTCYSVIAASKFESVSLVVASPMIPIQEIQCN